VTSLGPRLCLLPLSVILFAACSGSSERARGARADEMAIRAARAAQNSAIASGDLDRVAQFWTEDVEIRRGLGQLIVGREAYRQLFVAKGSRDSTLVYQREPERITISAKWPLAYESGTWSGHLGGVRGPLVIGGRYGAQWVRRADQWLIRGEVFVALECAGAGCAYSAAP
jgi:ketosteroid isomerase-like protein